MTEFSEAVEKQIRVERKEAARKHHRGSVTSDGETWIRKVPARDAAAREAAARESEAKPVTVNKAESSGSSFPSRSPSFNIDELARDLGMISNSNSTRSAGKKRDKKKGNRGNQSKKGKGKLVSPTNYPRRPVFLARFL